MTKSSPELRPKTEDAGREYSVLGLLGLGIFIVWLLLGTLPTCITQVPEERGQIGDMFGMANSLFSAFAFAGLIYTIWLQRRELALQREELAMTRQELHNSATAQADSAAALRQQVHLSAVAAKLSARASILSIQKDVCSSLKSLRRECQRLGTSAQLEDQLRKEQSNLTVTINDIFNMLNLLDSVIKDYEVEDPSKALASAQDPGT